MIDDTTQIIFIRIPKTGSTSIMKSLEPIHQNNDIGRVRPHLSVAEAKELYGNTKWNTYHKFTVVRNPWEMIVSNWGAKKKRMEYIYSEQWYRDQASIITDPNFDPVIDFNNRLIHLDLKEDENGHIPEAWFSKHIALFQKFHNIVDFDEFIFKDQNEPQVDTVLRFENLDAEWSNFVSTHSLTVNPLKHLNKSVHNADYRVYYNDTTRDMVANWCPKTISFFNYTF